MRKPYSGYDLIAGENLGSKKVVYIDSNGKAKLAKASSLITSRVVGCTFHSSDESNIVKVHSRGCLCGLSSLVPGDTYYLSQDTFGGITNIRPLSGIIIKIGVANSTTTLDIRIEDESVILTSPNGTKWLVNIDNDGVLYTEELE